MTLRGHVRDGAARVRLSLPARNGSLSIEFIIDTGFEGELALPGDIISRLDVNPLDRRPILLADGTLRYRNYYEILLDDIEEEPRGTEIVELEGRPLLGMDILSESLLQIEVTDGGEVSADPL